MNCEQGKAVDPYIEGHSERQAQRELLSLERRNSYGLRPTNLNRLFP